ncbi:MAG: hypothetical protein HUJ93_09245, partial [Bacteroidales bacterium]|nr:hypothetical protein [Bacteroidales bacterium]
MKYRYLHTILAASAIIGAISSCVEDKGNYDLEEINELTIEGIEDSYSLFSLTETLDVTPDLQPSVKGYSEDNYEYNWFVCEGALTTDGHKHTTISTERN